MLEYSDGKTASKYPANVGTLKEVNIILDIILYHVFHTVTV